MKTHADYKIGPKAIGPGLLLGTWTCMAHQSFYGATLISIIKPLYGISRSIATAAIGRLNADIRQLLSNHDAKALIMAFARCGAAIVTFFIGSLILG